MATFGSNRQQAKAFIEAVNKKIKIVYEECGCEVPEPLKVPTFEQAPSIDGPECDEANKAARAECHTELIRKGFSKQTADRLYGTQDA